MDNTIEENDMMKRCSSYDNTSIKSNFHKKLSSKDGLNPDYKVCRRTNYIKNLVKIKKYHLENRDKIITQQNEYKSNKYKTHIKFRLFKRTRNRPYHALKGKVKSSSTIDILGIDVETYRKWIE